MKTKSIIAVTVTLILSAVSVSCSGEDSKHDHGSMVGTHNTAKTKVVMLDDTLQAAFDVTTMKDHMDMMKKMGVSMDHSSSADHILTVTLMKKPENKVVKDADVKLTVTGPDGNSLTNNTEIMEGGGMFHYAAEFNASDKGDYKVKASVSNGGKTYEKEVSFNL